MKKISGIVKKDKKTKNLIMRLKPGEIALIDHEDIDYLSAKLLIEKKIKAILNISSSFTGKFLNTGILELFKNRILIIEELDRNLFEKIKDGEKITILENKIYRDGELLGEGKILKEEVFREKLKLAEKNINRELQLFAENTIEYIKKEGSLLLSDISFPELRTNIKNRHVLIVVRGRDYKEDLRMLKNYIDEIKPVLIGVDGGADALLEFGYKPDIIVGDMDSVSDEALKCGAEILLHTYPEKDSPGVERIKKLKLSYKTISLPCISEDIALLLAYHSGAILIVGVGMHFSLIEFLEKGRKGMSSTFLTRLKVGSILVDAKGVSKLYHSFPSIYMLIFLITAGIIPILIVFFTSPVSLSFLKLFKIWIGKNFGF
jgi:uncharacterized membrane-anchored protein